MHSTLRKILSLRKRYIALQIIIAKWHISIENYNMAHAREQWTSNNEVELMPLKFGYVGK